MTHSKVSSFWDTEGNRKELAERVRREDETLDDSDLECEPVTQAQDSHHTQAPQRHDRAAVLVTARGKRR